MNYAQEVIEEENILSSRGSLIDLLKHLFSVKNIFCFVIAYMVSRLEFVSGIMPFSFAIIAAMYVYNIPMVIPLIASTLGILGGGFGPQSIYEYLGGAILFLIISSFIKIEGVNRKISTGMKILFSVAVVELIKILISDALLTATMNGIFVLIALALFYVLFTSAMFVFININKPAIFSSEELIAFAVMIAVASLAFRNINIFNLSFINLIGIILVLIVGYKNGAMSGCMTGTLIGLLFGIISNNSAMYIVTFAFSGLLSGLLNKLGKVGVVVGFIIGNMLISYILTGQTQLLQGLNEVIVASLALIVIPKKLELRVDSIFNKNPMLESAYGNYLADSQDTKSKLEAISSVFEDLSRNISSVNIDDQTKQETKYVVMGFLESYKEKNCLGCKNFKTCLTTEKIKLSSDYIVEAMENRKSIKENTISVDCNKSREIQNEIHEIYNNIKIAYLLRQKEIENTKKIAKQYKEVANIINKMSKNLIPNKRQSSDLKLEETIKQELKLFGYNIYDSEYIIDNGRIEYTFITDLLTNIDKQKEEIQNVVSSTIDKDMQINLILNSSKTEKAKIKLVSEKYISIEYSACNISREDISGDNYLVTKTEESKYLIALADGEGTGEDASKSSKKALNLIEKLLKTGFSKTNALETINSILKIRGDNSRFSTIDICIVDVQKSEAEFIKYGAAPTFIISNKKVSIINADSLPIGVVEHVSYIPNSKKLNPGDVIVLLSDGVITEKDRENNIRKFVSKLKTYSEINDLDRISKELADFAKKQIDAKDDITVLLVKIV